MSSLKGKLWFITSSSASRRGAASSGGDDDDDSHHDDAGKTSTPISSQTSKKKRKRNRYSVTPVVVVRAISALKEGAQHGPDEDIFGSIVSGDWDKVS